MAVSRKGRRRIVRSGRVFYWCVRHDDEEEYRLYLVISSDDKHFLVSYMLGQKDTARAFSPKVPLIIVKGREFKGLPGLGGRWERFAVPEWDDSVVTPALVGQIIDWCFTEAAVTPVDWRGNIAASRET